MKKAGELWGKMSDKEKKKYEDLHKKDKERYDRQMADLNKQGWFKMDDGSKSNEHKKVDKKAAKKAKEEEEEEPPKKKQKK